MGIYSLLDEFGFVELSAIGSLEEIKDVELVARGAKITLCTYIVTPRDQAPIYFRCRQNHAPAFYIETGQATLVVSDRGAMLFAFGEYPDVRDALQAAGFERHIDDYV